MLVLTRKSDETIVVGDDTEIRVLAIKGGRVRLGISAPRDVAITRAELIEGLPEESLEPATSEPVACPA